MTDGFSSSISAVSDTEHPFLYFFMICSIILDAAPSALPSASPCALASGELKHGPIALITTNTPVVATVTQEKLMSKELSNIKEVKSRGADIVLFIKEALSGDLDTEYQVIKLPDMQDEFMVLPASVALQLLAYYVSSDKGFDVDKPRNLAKVVTVE